MKAQSTMREMPKIFIDTGFFIDLYWKKIKIQPVLETITKIAPSLVLPEQVKDEFIRNHDTTINAIRSCIKDEKCVDISRYGLFSRDEDFVTGSELSGKHKDLKTRLDQRCVELIANPEQDEIFRFVLELFYKPEVQKIPRSEAIIARASERKMIGNPPLSRDKNTIGDEVIWESLLASVSDDLIILSKDGTYKKHWTYLSREFTEKNKKKLIGVFNEVSKVLPYFNEEPSKELEEFESEQEKIEEEEKLEATPTGGFVIDRIFVDYPTPSSFRKLAKGFEWYWDQKKMLELIKTQPANIGPVTDEKDPDEEKESD